MLSPPTSQCLGGVLPTKNADLYPNTEGGKIATSQSTGSSDYTSSRAPADVLSSLHSTPPKWVEDPFDESTRDVVGCDVTSSPPSPPSPRSSSLSPPPASSTVPASALSELPNDTVETSNSLSDSDPLSTLPDDPALDDFFSHFTRHASIVTINPAPCSRSPSVALASLPSAILSSYPSTHSQSLGKSDINGVGNNQGCHATASKNFGVVPLIPPEGDISTFRSEPETETDLRKKQMRDNLQRLLLPTSHPSRAELISVMDTVLALLRQATAHRHILLQQVIVITMEAISSSTKNEHLHMRSTLLLLSVMTAHANIMSALLLSPQTIRQLLVVLGTFRSNPYIQSRTLAILTPIVRHAVAVPVFVAHRGVELVVWSLENFKSIRPVLTHGCALLRTSSLQGGANVAHRVCRIGTLSVMASALSRWTVTPSVQVAILAALPAFVGSSATNQWIAGRSSSLVRAVVAVMRSQPYSPVIQLVGSLAMSALCTECAGNRIQAIDADFMEAAVMALTLFGEDAAIAHAVFCSLENVSTDCSAAQCAYLHFDALQAVAHTTRLHTTDIAVTLRSAGCLRRAFREDSVRTCAHAPTTLDVLLCVIESIGNSTANYPDVGQNSAVAEVFAALANGVFQCESNARYICTRKYGEASGLGIIIQRLRWSLPHADAQLHGLRALRNISAQIPLDEELSDLVHIVLTAMVGHFTNPGAQSQATHCLLNIIFVEKGKAEKSNRTKVLDIMRHFGVGEVIQSFRGAHSDNVELQSIYDLLLAQTSLLKSTTMLRRGSVRNQRSYKGKAKDNSTEQHETMSLD